MRTAQIKLLSAMALWGTMSLFVKNINLTSAEIALYRAIIAVVTLVLLRVLLHQKIDWQACRKDWLGLLISGSALGLNGRCCSALINMYPSLSQRCATTSRQR